MDERTPEQVVRDALASGTSLAIAASDRTCAHVVAALREAGHLRTGDDKVFADHATWHFAGADREESWWTALQKSAYQAVLRERERRKPKPEWVVERVDEAAPLRWRVRHNSTELALVAAFANKEAAEAHAAMLEKGGAA